MNDKPLPPEFALLLSSSRNQGAPSVPEALLLLKAFVDIQDPGMRATIVNLVERIAAARKPS